MKTRVSLVAAIAVSALSVTAAHATDDSVYTQSNSSQGNRLLTFTRNANGTLTRSLTYPTGGNGSGGGLGAGSVSVSKDGKDILVVNAGSNTLTYFHKEAGTIVFQDVEPTGGFDPISVTQSGRFVYVLNQGNAVTPGDVQEFVKYQGHLVLIYGATYNFAAPGNGAQQVKFTPNGDGLVVTEELTNLIDTIQLDYFARPISVNSQSSVGANPFGFDFDNNGRLYVTDANGGVANTSFVTAYNLSSNLTVSAIGQPAATHWTAACWDAVSPSGEYLYSSDAHSGTITGFRISSIGSLTTLQSTGLSADPGGATLDLSFSADGNYLYVVLAGTPSIVTYRVWPNGALQQIGSISLPAGSAGLAQG